MDFNHFFNQSKLDMHSTMKLSDIPLELIISIMRFLPLHDRLAFAKTHRNALNAFQMEAPDWLVRKFGYHSVNVLIYSQRTPKFISKVLRKLPADVLSNQINQAAFEQDWRKIAYMLRHGVSPKHLVYSIRRTKAHANQPTNEQADNLRQLISKCNPCYPFDSVKLFQIDREKLLKATKDHGIVFTGSIENIADLNGLLSQAACKRCIGIVQVLTRAGADIYSDELMRQAIRGGGVEVVWFLTVCGADINRTLMMAVQENRLQLCKTLLDRSCNGRFIGDVISQQHNNFFSKFLVDYPQAFGMFIDLGMNIHRNNEEYLRWAAENNRLQLTKILLDKGADIHADNDYALRWAALKGHMDMVKLLLDRGASIHANDDYAFRWAARNGHLEMVQLLLDRGANIHADENSALQLAVKKDHQELVKLLLRNGADGEVVIDQFKKSNFAKAMNSLSGQMENIRISVTPATGRPF